MNRNSSNAGETYLADRLCSRQWAGLLQALAAEFNAHLSEQDLADMLCRIGERFASSQPLPAVETVEQLQDGMNAHWLGTDWGTVELSSLDDQMVIEHRFSPLASAFGMESAAWSGAFLKGVYRQWLHDAGAGDELNLVEDAGLDEWGCITFRLEA